MATTAVFTGTLTFTGDTQQTQDISASPNQASPANEQLVNLSIGANAFPVPVGGGTVPTRVTIVPPVGNTNVITLKGVSGDTGFPLHKTDPTTIALDPTFTTLTLTVSSLVSGVRIIWS